MCKYRIHTRTIVKRSILIIIYVWVHYAVLCFGDAKPLALQICLLIQCRVELIECSSLDCWFNTISLGALECAAAKNKDGISRFDMEWHETLNLSSPKCIQLYYTYILYTKASLHTPLSLAIVVNIKKR